MRLRDFALVILLSVPALAATQPTVAQGDVSSASLALLEKFEERSVNGDYYARNKAFDTLLRQYRTTATSEPGMALALFVIETQVSIERRDAFLKSMYGWMSTKVTDRDEAVNATRMAVAGLILSDPPTPPTGEQLYSLAEALDRLGAAGITLSEIAGEDSHMLGYMSNLLDGFKAGVAAIDLASGNIQHAERDVRDLLAIASGANTYIAGPAGVAFAGIQGYNVRGADLIVQGVDLLADGFGGEFDHARYEQLSAELDAHLHGGPWTSETGQEILKKWAENLPIVGKAFKALWPDLPDTCKALTCDCEGGGYLNIGGVAKDQCYATQSRIINQCRIDETIRESCDSTASGPNANPKPS